MFWLHYIGGSESHPWLILKNGGTQTVWKDPVRPLTDKTIPSAGQTRWRAGPGHGDNVLGNWVCRVRTMHTLHTWDHKVKLYQPHCSPFNMCCIEWIWYAGRVARCAIWLVALAPIRVVSHSERLVLPQKLLTADIVCQLGCEAILGWPVTNTSQSTINSKPIKINQIIWMSWENFSCLKGTSKRSSTYRSSMK